MSVVKYFIENTRARKFEDGLFAGWKFKKHVMFEVDADKAYDLYAAIADRGELDYGRISWAWETGARFYVNENSVVICGIEMSDEELFKRRLNGTVGKEVFK